jgi:hypothetical protein
MNGDRIRITFADGRSLTGTETGVDDATWIPRPATNQGYDFLTVIKHRPQWPSMCNQTKILHGVDDVFYTETGEPVTLELLEPAPQPGPKLVRRDNA